MGNEVKYLFRGKRKDNGKWVYGGITFDMDGTLYICPERFSDYDDEIEVLSETVGQFTGLTDKNGINIFCGDILCEWWVDFDNISKPTGNIFEVVQHFGAYKLKLVQTTKDNEDRIGEWFGLIVSPQRMEVIATTYDNPELLGDKNDNDN